MTDADAVTVARVAERMRALVEALPPRTLGNDSQTITISIGTLSRVPAAADSAEALLERADQALCRAKSAGRNCIRSADAWPTVEARSNQDASRTAGVPPACSWRT